ncbi:MAG: PTH1 family peptidyl-tRNA hydrolase [Gammaproteobacteria bacterium]
MDSGIRLIAGLGNPGSRYESTRHNAGFWFVDRIAAAHKVSWKSEPRLFGAVAQLRVGGEVIRLLKPMTFMNESGRSLGAVCRYFGLQTEQVLVAHDEIDLVPGVVRLKRGGGHGGHNGLRDIIPQLGGPQFARLRIGVGHPGTKEQVIGYVLARANAQQSELIDDAIGRAVDRVDDMLTHGLERVMNELHRHSPQ